MVETPAELVNLTADFTVARREFNRGRRGTRVIFGSQAELLVAKARFERQQHHNRGGARPGSVYERRVSLPTKVVVSPLKPTG